MRSSVTVQRPEAAWAGADAGAPDCAVCGGPEVAEGLGAEEAEVPAGAVLLEGAGDFDAVFDMPPLPHPTAARASTVTAAAAAGILLRRPVVSLPAR
jgi:hypothetical protein